MKHAKMLLLGIVVVPIALAACGPTDESLAESAAETPTATSANIEEVSTPVEASTQVPEPEPSLIPTDVFTATDSPTPEPPTLPQVTVTALFTYVRSGPGTMYEVVATATQGLVLEIEGRSWAGNWLATQLPWGERGWVFGPDVSSDIDVGALRVLVVAEPTEQPFYTITVSNRTGGELVISIFEIGFSATYITSSPKSFTLQGGTYTFTVKIKDSGAPCIMTVTVVSDVYWEPTSDKLCPPF